MRRNDGRWILFLPFFTLLAHAVLVVWLGGRINAALVFGIPIHISLWMSLSLLGVSLFFLVYARFTHGRLRLALLLGGSGGFVNALSRLTLGGVHDYFTLPFFPFMFNLPDILLTSAAILLLLPLRGSRNDSRIPFQEERGSE